MSRYDSAVTTEVPAAGVISFGAGVNSTAMTTMLVNGGWRGPIVFADTGAEWPETYCYMRYFEHEWLAPRGLSVTVLRGLPWQKYLDGASLIDYCEHAHVIPIPAVRWCTARWKVEPLQRWCEANGETEQLIGIAADEAHRKPDACRPLVDAGIDRKGCIKIIQHAGLDVPQKSGCYICPFQRNAQWRALWERHPELFERAARLEESVVRSASGRYIAMIDAAGKMTLRMREASYRGQMQFPEIDMDDLLAYKPCLCEL